MFCRAIHLLLCATLPTFLRPARHKHVRNQVAVWEMFLVSLVLGSWLRKAKTPSFRQFSIDDAASTWLRGYDMSYNLNSLKGFYTELLRGLLQGSLRGILGMWTAGELRAHVL